MSLGTRHIDDVLTFYATTTKFDTGVGTDADSVPTYRVYEEETTTPLLTGSMALLDSSNTAGFYSEQITLSAANGFEVGKSYSIYIAATVNSVAGVTHQDFVVRKKPLTPTTEGRELDVTTTGGAGIDWSNVEAPTTTLNLSGTTVKTATDVETDTQDIQTRLPSALTTGGRMKASVEAILDTAFTEGASGRIAAAFKQFFNIASPAATMDHGVLIDTVGSVGSVTAGVTVTTNNDKTDYELSSTGIQAIWDALTSALTTVGSIGKLLVDNINATISSRLASASYTPPPTVGQIADQVWDEALSGHAIAGSTGEALSAAGSAGDPWITDLPGSYTGTQAGKVVSDIKAQTDKLTFDADNAVDANIQKINDTELTGDGSTGTPWGPV